MSRPTRSRTAELLLLAPWLASALLGLAGAARAESPRSLLEQGHAAYNEGRFEAALELFARAQIELPEDATIQYNIGDALYSLGRFEAARGAFEAAARDGALRLVADAHYNEGNSLFRAGRYRDAVDRYRRVLELEPEAADAKHNLEMARRMLDEKPPDGGQAPEQRGSDDTQQEQAPSSSPPTPEPQPPPEPSPHGDRPQPSPVDMTPQQSERLLDSLERAERAERKATKRPRGAPVQTEIDW